MKKERKKIVITPENKRKIKIISYILTFLLPLIYVFFFSESNFKKHQSLRSEAKKTQEAIDLARGYLSNQYTYEEIQQNPRLMEKYIREELNMKKPNEDVFIIEE